MSVLLRSYQDENRINYSNCKPGVGGGGLGSSLVESKCAMGHMCRAPTASGSREVGWKLVPRISQDLSQMLTG